MIFKKVAIKDICDFVGGAQPPKEVFISEPKEGYIRLIQTRDYKTDNFLTYIPINKARRFCNANDIMIGRYGPPVFQILRGLEGAYNVALMKAIPKTNVLNDYLYYFLKQKSVFEYVEGLSLRTGGQTGVDLDSLNEYPVPLPNLVYQKQVVGVLKSLDAKIAINNRINAELEAMTKTLYDYWFVQFDFPDDNGKPYKTSGGKMVYNPELKREIPEEWEVGSINRVGKLMGGGTPKTTNNSFWNGCIPFFTPKDAEDSYFILETESKITESGLSSCSSRLYPKGTVFITARGTVGKINIASQDMAMNQSCYAVMPNEGVNYYFLHQCCIDLVQYLKAKAGGSIFDAIVSNDINLTNLVCPPSDLINVYGNKVQGFYETILVNKKQNQQLTELRDWLLPMLMNGQITVKEAEVKMVMAAEPEGAYNQ